MRKRRRFLGVELATVIILIMGLAACKPNTQKSLKTVDATCEQQLALQFQNQKWKVPYCAESISQEEHAQINRVVIIVPGADRNSQKQFSSIIKELRETPEIDKKVQLMTVQFLVERDVKKHHKGEHFLYWTNSWDGWKYGHDAVNPEAVDLSISSFEVMDSILMDLPKTFPNLRKIVLAGHSAGGQFVNRYAAINRVHARIPRKISLEYVIANPSSYLYFTADRPTTGGKFQPPTSTERENCRKFNEYKFGLEDLEDCNYAFQTGEEKIRAQYPLRKVTYLLGESDNNPRHKSIDRSCQAQLQGANRYDRGIKYYHYLQHLYGPNIRQNQTLKTIPGVGHSVTRMFTSPIGRETLFNPQNP